MGRPARRRVVLIEGRVLTAGGVRPESRKVDLLENDETPACLREGEGGGGGAATQHTLSPGAMAK